MLGVNQLDLNVQRRMTSGSISQLSRLFRASWTAKTTPKASATNINTCNSSVSNLIGSMEQSYLLEPNSDSNLCKSLFERRQTDDQTVYSNMPLVELHSTRLKNLSKQYSKDHDNTEMNLFLQPISFDQVVKDDDDNKFVKKNLQLKETDFDDCFNQFAIKQSSKILHLNNNENIETNKNLYKDYEMKNNDLSTVSLRLSTDKNYLKINSLARPNNQLNRLRSNQPNPSIRDVMIYCAKSFDLGYTNVGISNMETNNGFCTNGLLSRRSFSQDSQIKNGEQKKLISNRPVKFDLGVLSNNNLDDQI